VTRALFACTLFLLLPSLAFAGDFERGLEALNKKDFDLAITCFDAHIRANAKDAVAFYKRGNAYVSKNEYDKAIEDYSEAIHLDSKYAYAFNNRGDAYAYKQEYDKAIEDFSEAIRLDPKYAPALSNRGLAYAYKEDYDKAVEDCSEAIRLNPTYAHAFNSRGFAYAKKQEYDKAIKDFSETIRLDPQYANALGHLAWLLATCPKDGLRDGKKAVQLATKACELSEWKLSSYLEILAAAHAECGDFKQAVKWQKKAIELGYENKDEGQKAVKRLRLYQEGKLY